MKKIGLLILALVVALGALGVGYARWMDTVTIKGTVSTAKINFVTEARTYSGMYVFKNPSTDAMEVKYTKSTNAAPAILTSAMSSTIGSDWKLISYAQAKAGANPDEVNMVFSKLFPIFNSNGKYLPYSADFSIKYTGTIPIHIEARVVARDGSMVNLPIIFKYFVKTSDTSPWAAKPLATGKKYIQVHENESVMVKACVVVPEFSDSHLGAASKDLANQGKDLTNAFTVKIFAYQWNEEGPAIDVNNPDAQGTIDSTITDQAEWDSVNGGPSVPVPAESELIVNDP